MGKKSIDLTGKRFGRLVVHSRGPSGARNASRWVCLCDCGNQVSVADGNLKSGCTTSCGCYRREVLRRGALSLRKHGMSGTKELAAWQHMHSRCYTESDKRFQRYGGRGIKVCERWHSFAAFLEDMGKAPSADHSIDRIDVDGNYEPGNCRWATSKQQNRNRTNNRIVEINDVAKPLAEWCEEYGVSYALVSKRLRRGWPPVEALTTPNLLDTSVVWGRSAGDRMIQRHREASK